MAGKTPTEKISDLSNVVASLTAQLDALRGQVNGVDAEQAKMADSLSDLKTKLALLEQRLEDLKQGKEEWGRRLWAIVGPILGAFVGGVLGYFLRR